MQQSVLPALKEHPTTLSDRVYAVLLAAIVDWRIRPGERLILDDMAAQMRVSRTPIRDALSRLATEGLVEVQGKRGFRAALLSPHDLRELYTLRRMCETFAVEDGCARATPELLAAMDRASRECAALRGSSDPADRVESQVRDAEFHRGIVGLAGSGRLIDLFNRLNIHMHAAAVGPRPGLSEERIGRSLAEHLAIVDGLRRCDVVAAKDAVHRHILGAQEVNIAALVRNQAVGDSTNRPASVESEKPES